MKRMIFIAVVVLLSIDCSAQVYNNMKTWYTYKRLPIDTILVRQLDTIQVVILVSDTSLRNAAPVAMVAYSVRAKYNTSEGVVDAGLNICIDEKGNPISCWQDYWKHLFYLNKQKIPLPRKYVVWNHIEIKD